MKAVLRWIAVLPGAVAAMVAVNIINGLTVGELAPDFVNECSKAWFGSIGFILAAYYIAPTGKAITAIVVATAYCSTGLIAVFITLKSGESHHPTWLVILDSILSVLASIVACVVAWEFEKSAKADRKPETSEF